MNNDQRDPHLPFDEVVRDLKREHRSRRHHHRSAHDARPPTGAELQHRRQARWLAVVIGLGLAAVAVALLFPL